SLSSQSFSSSQSSLSLQSFSNSVPIHNPFIKENPTQEDTSSLRQILKYPLRQHSQPTEETKTNKEQEGSQLLKQKRRKTMPFLTYEVKMVQKQEVQRKKKEDTEYAQAEKQRIKDMKRLEKEKI
ncbi:4169_t:CDS:2, partial [Dentiscutata erythropus]